jgi:hypothetical protein
MANAVDISALVEQIKPIFAGKPPEIQSAALADCVAIYLAGHIIPDAPDETAELRERLLAIFVDVVRELVPINERIIHDEPESAEEDDDAPSLGPCCICEGLAGVCNIIMLDRRCAVSGHGWGCAVCDLPADGASAVLCDDCMELYRREPERLTIACRGYPATDGRIAIAELPPFGHDMTKHPEADEPRGVA